MFLRAHEHFFFHLENKVLEIVVIYPASKMSQRGLSCYLKIVTKDHSYVCLRKARVLVREDVHPSVRKRRYQERSRAILSLACFYVSSI